MQAGMHCTRMCQVQANSIMKFNFKANSRRHQLDSQLDTNWVFPKPKYVQIDPTRCNYMEPQEWSFQATRINSLVQHSCLFSFLVFLLRMKSSSFHVRVFSFGRSFSASSALASVLHHDIGLYGSPWHWGGSGSFIDRSPRHWGRALIANPWNSHHHPDIEENSTTWLVGHDGGVIEITLNLGFMLPWEWKVFLGKSLKVTKGGAGGWESESPICKLSQPSRGLEN